MALRDVGGKSVYIIEAAPVAAAKASNGVGFAQLVTQLRWKIWEKAEDQVLRELEFEKMGYQAQLDAYVKQKQELTRALGKTKDLKEQLASGKITATQYYNAAKAEADAIRRQQERDLKYGTTRITEREAFDPLGDKQTLTTKSRIETNKDVGRVPTPSSLLGQTAKLLGADTPEDRKQAAVAAADAEAKKLANEWNASFKANNPANLSEKEWGSSPEGADIEKRLGDAFAQVAKLKAIPPSQFPSAQDAENEADIENFARDLQAQIDALEAPRMGFDTNVLSRTREQFGGMAGTGGLGFAPRRSKISPIYDEGRAKEALARQAGLADEFIRVAETERSKEITDQVVKAKNMNRQNRITELQAFDPAGADPKIQEQLKALSENVITGLSEAEAAQVSRQARDLAMQEYRDAAMLAGPGERTAGQFMSRYEPPSARPPSEDGGREKKERKDTDFNFLANLGKLTGEGIPSVYFGSGEGGEAGLSGTAPEGALTVEGRQFRQGGAPDSASIIPDLQTDVGFGATTMPESGAPRREPLDTDSNFRKVMQRLSAESGRQPGDSAPSPVTIGGEAGIGGPAQLPRVAPPEPRREPPPPTPGASASGLEQAGGREKAAEDLYVFYGRKIVKDTGVELVPLTSAEKEKIWDKWLAEEETTSTLDEAGAKKWYSDAINEIKSLDTGAQKKTQTRQEKYAAQKMKIIKAGSDLANKPSKLMRIAKTDLPEKERAKVVPEHILLVEKIYNINKDKANAYSISSNEISRIYKNDDKKRAAAQEYLTATHLLYSDNLS